MLQRPGKNYCVGQHGVDSSLKMLFYGVQSARFPSL